jgi:hypothetical protein
MEHRPAVIQVLKNILEDWINEEFDDVIVIPSLTKFGIWYSMEKILMDVIIGFFLNAV